jgi:hypothetical protein
MATITSSAARAADSLYNTTPSKGSASGIIIGLCVITLFSNILGVRVCTTFGDPSDGEYADGYYGRHTVILNEWSSG